VVTTGAKAHDEVVQRTQVPQRPESHQELRARWSLRNLDAATGVDYEAASGCTVRPAFIGAQDLLRPA